MATMAPADDCSEIRDTRPAPAPDRAVLAAATADNTRNAYRSAVNHYLACGGVLPADVPASSAT